MTVLTEGGNGNGKPCKFPFRFNATTPSVDTCVTDQGNPSNWWCSTTADYDRDRERGFCKTGITENKFFKVCNRKFRTFSCPKNYLINLVSVEGIKTTDGSCDEK